MRVRVARSRFCLSRALVAKECCPFLSGNGAADRSDIRKRRVLAISREIIVRVGVRGVIAFLLDIRNFYLIQEMRVFCLYKSRRVRISGASTDCRRELWKD